jgi:hypothetical protein
MDHKPGGDTWNATLPGARNPALAAASCKLRVAGEPVYTALRGPSQAEWK